MIASQRLLLHAALNLVRVSALVLLLQLVQEVLLLLPLHGLLSLLYFKSTDAAGLVVCLMLSRLLLSL